MRTIKIASALLLGCASGVAGEKYIPLAIPKDVRIIEKPVPVHVPAKSLKEIIEEIPPKYGIPPLLAAAIVHQESGGNTDAVRFEPGQVARAKRVAPRASEHEIRMLASSLGAFQVMAWHAPTFGLRWSELLDPETNAEVAMAILRSCLDRHTNKKTKYEQVRGGLACYNGSERYADAVLARLGRILVEANL